MAEEGGTAWGIKPGMAWAEEVEQEEAKHGPLASEEAFPSLGEAVKAAPVKKKKEKPVKMALGAFVAAGRRPLSDQELLQQLPKGSSGLPKEEGSGMGGAFRDYSGNREGARGGRRDGERDEREPSRADAVSDWGSERKFVPTESSGGRSGFGGGGFRDREGAGGGGGGFGERRGGGGGFGDRPPTGERPVSEADTVDDWGANRKFAPSTDSGRGGGGGGGFGGGSFRDRPAGGGPGRDGEPSRAETGDWGSRRAPPPAEGGDRGGLGASGSRRGYGFSEQPMSAADLEDKWSHRGGGGAGGGGDGASSSAAASGGSSERPRLKLAPRTLPLPDLPPPATQQQAAAAGGGANGVGPSPAGSEAGSSGSGQQQQQQPAADKPRRSNPFGDARPREEVLKEKGIDYHKEELKLEHGEVLRDPTPEEQEAEKEVEALRRQLEELTAASPDEVDTISDLKKELDERERALYTLQAKLDDELRYSKHRPSDRDGAAPRGSSSSSAPPAAEDMSGFEPVRNPRKERAAAAAAAGPAAPGSEGGDSGGSKEQEGGGGGAAGGAWGRGGGSMRDREGGPGRGGGGGGSFRDRDGPRPGAPPPPRERRTNESLSGRTGGGW